MTNRTEHKQTHQISPPEDPFATEVVRGCQADGSGLRPLAAISAVGAPVRLSAGMQMRLI